MVVKRKQANILLVDDSATNIALLEAVLEENGYQIIKAQCVKDALTSIKKKLPDLILLDLLIPKISGFDFFEQIRNDERTKNVPVIVISALSDKMSEERVLAMGAVDFLRKPVDIQYLTKKVTSILGPRE
jgi:CheY-like chemotaxis protein